MIKLFCKGEGDGVNSFHCCADFSDKQCTLCEHEKNDATDDLCQLCLDLVGKPYFEKKKQDT
jgi:hypothetical protein